MTSLLQASSAIRIGIRHLLLYAPLLRDAALEYREAFVRRLLLLLVGAGIALVAAMVCAVWLVMSLWNSEFHHWFIALVVVALLLVSVALVRASTAARPAGPHGRKLRYELAQDHELIREWNEERHEQSGS